MLRFDRKQQNSVKQLPFKKNFFFEKKEKKQSKKKKQKNTMVLNGRALDLWCMKPRKRDEN